MGNDIGGAVVGLFSLFIFALWAYAIALAVFVPVWMVLLLRRLSTITTELRRMNGMPVPHGGGLFPNATERKPERQAQSLGHQLLR
jgi:hypothetical protein